jgi:NAD(P)-dependent dehydrogenase (short-subunit alcohol dehydrogenase family)
MTLCVTGTKTTLVAALALLLPCNERLVHWDSLPNPSSADRFFFAQGHLTAQSAATMSSADMIAIAEANWLDVVEKCERVLAHNHTARICLMGSESGFKGSFNEVYANSKAALHHYVETKHLKWPQQQLVAVAPTVIEDTGMTQRRHDLDRIMKMGAARRRGHWLYAKDVARMVKFLLYEDSGAVCNTVVRMTGGNW